MSSSNRTNRREFLGTTAATAATAWAGANLYAADAPANPGPNDTINMALIGCGARGGNQVMPSFMELPGVRMTAVCDVNSTNLARIRVKAGGDQVAAYRDFRKLLEDKSIDAVIVATQAHWHVPIAVAACQAGKDVYLEKPLGNSIGEGRYLIEAAKKYYRIVQIGTQQHSMEHYRKAVEMIQSGRLGDISEVKVWDHTYSAPGRGFPADCDPPAELDWDFYVGPAPMRPYNPNVYYKYGYDWFKLSGAGHQVAWGVHHFDIVAWAMSVKYPIAASAMGGHFAYQDNFEWPNTFDGMLEFGPGPVAKNGFILQYTMRMGSRRVRRSHAKCFYGTEATMVVDRSRISIAPEPKGKKTQLAAGYLLSEEEEILPVDDKFRHSEVFLENIRERKQPETDAQTGHYATNFGHLMNISWEVGRSIRWDGEKEQVIGDEEANALVTKPYRAPVEAGGVIFQPVMRKRFNETTESLSLTYCDDTPEIGGNIVTKYLAFAITLLLGATLAATADADHPVRFEVRLLAVDANEGCDIADVDGDGKLDVVAGRNWYRNGEWVARAVRIIEDNNGYARTNGEWAYDMNGDGRPDVVSVDFTSSEVYWYENPGEEKLLQGYLWPKHLLVDTGWANNEVSYLIDLTGDGKPEWHSNQWNKKNPTVIWTLTTEERDVEIKKGRKTETVRREMPTLVGHTIGPINGHGVGFGDINNDGRDDVLFGLGWYEHPEGDPLAQEWKYHPDWEKKHAACPMLVYDVDGDGKNDVINSVAHGYGLHFWRSLGPDADGKLQFDEQLIDDSFSQPHCLVLADLDGDGKDELITGKRIRAHNGNDPGAAEPPIMRYYVWDANKKAFDAHTINEGQAGGGLQIRTADLDADGDTDIVVAGKEGTQVLFNVHGDAKK